MSWQHSLTSTGCFGALNLPFLGVYALPTRLIGLTWLVVVGVKVSDGQESRLDARDAE